jgi:hypothetical protein
LLGECVGEISAGFEEQYLRGVLGSRPLLFLAGSAASFHGMFSDELQLDQSR